jgi:hypothetical protein
MHTGGAEIWLQAFLTSKLNGCSEDRSERQHVLAVFYITIIRSSGKQLCFTKIPHQWDPIYLGYKTYTVIGYHESDKTMSFGLLKNYVLAMLD